MLVDVGKAPVLAFVQRNGADLQLEGHEFLASPDGLPASGDKTGQCGSRML